MVKIMAHRGASSIALENSKEAFLKALEFKVDYVELDVRRCYTGELIVIHDSKVNRISNGDGYVKMMSLKEIKSLIMLNGEKILTLAEALEILKGKCKVNIEIKSRNLDYEIADSISALVEKMSMKEDVIVSSFNHKVLRYLKHINPDVETAALFIRKKSPGVFLRRLHYIGTFIRKTKHIGSSHMNLPHQFVTKKVVEKARASGLKVNAWTVNSDKAITRMVDIGVNSIITDYPQRFMNHSDKVLADNYKLHP